MYRKQISQKASPSLRTTPISTEIDPSPSYGSLSSVVQRAQLDPNSVSEDERQQLESAIGSRSTKEILAGKQTPWVPEFQGISAQLWDNAGQVDAPIQAKRKDDVGVSEVQPENKTGLPDNLKAGIENLSGIAMDNVRVHYNSSKPAQLQALAYTQGTDIHVAPGQEKHLPHEAWHVVQQMQGRVKPTMQMKGVQINDDEGLEREANVMGESAWQQSYIRQNGNDAKVSDNFSALYHQRVEISQPQKQLSSVRGVAQCALHPNVGDQKYRQEANKNLKFEVEVGKVLMSDRDIKRYAESIRKLSGAPLSTWNMTPEDIEELSHLVGPIGGAMDLAQDKDTLDAHVLATHIKVDRAEFNDPEAPNRTRRQNMFNRVMSQDNPIYPWNIHDFDMGLHEVETWSDIPREMAELITHRWEEYRLDDESYAKTISLQSLGNVVGLGAMAAKDIFNLLTKEERKTFLYDILYVKWSTTEHITDEITDTTSRDPNPLGSDYRQHNTGDRANVVRGSDPNDPKVAKWIQEAIGFSKPIISGPSGHSLRYLNHWATVRSLNYYSGGLMLGRNLVAPEIFPSLAEARLVMMGNLMPPKNHHSYHEIMLASIGISDGIDTLQYNHKDSYEDLKETPVGKRAFERATEALETPNSEPLPNPWKNQKKPNVSGWPPSTAQDLFGILYRFGTDKDMAQLIIMNATKIIQLQVIPLIKEAASDGRITNVQKEFILDIIRDLVVPKQ